MSNKIYFDNAATTPLAPEVKEAMVDVMDNLHGNPSSIHAHGREARARIEQARKTIANGLKASIGEIFFTSSATESNNTILRRAVTDLKVSRIITSPIEHHCVYHTCQDLEKNYGIEVIYLNVDSTGIIDKEQLSTLLKEDKKTLVSLMYGNNEIGTITPINEISKLCREHGAYIHSDAVQVIGKYPIDLQETSLDFMSGTGHKFFGPKGAGFMYINGENSIQPFHTGGAQERNMRAGTENIYGIIGLAAAFQLALDKMDERKVKTLEIRNYMKSSLQEAFSDIEFNGQQNGDFLYHILSVSFPPSPKNDMLIYNLDIHGICASAGSACSSGTNTGSHVLAAIAPDSPRNTIRLSFSHHNTKDEVDFVVAKLQESLS
ncbi:cysteine desulfurase [Saprospiraceae bacterium]|nr:cysteine desulfurase [Saprospiraceae bacterium]